MCSDKRGLNVHSFHTYWMTAAVNVFVQTLNKHSLTRPHTSGGVEQTGALKFKEIDLCYQTHNSRHCGHMAGGHVFQLVASEKCVTEQADTQQRTKYSASGFFSRQDLSKHGNFSLRKTQIMRLVSEMWYRCFSIRMWPSYSGVYSSTFWWLYNLQPLL